MELNIAIVDDLSEDRKKLAEGIRKYAKAALLLTEIHNYESGEAFLAAEQKRPADLVFLDIFLDGMSGMEVAQRLRQTNGQCLLVFVSTSRDFAPESYEVQALYYLVKPYDYAQLARVMDRALRCGLRQMQVLELTVSREKIRLPIVDILFVDYYNHYVQLHTADGLLRTYTVTFREVAETLCKYPNFLICYRNLLINMDKVLKIEGKDFLLCDGTRVPINRGQAVKIKEQYAQYCFERMEEELSDGSL